MARLVFGFAAALAALLSVPALAQDQSREGQGASRSADIVVTGGRERADALTRGLARGSVSGVLPRWSAPICVRMIGMQADAAQAFENRVREVAVMAGASVGAPGCDPNLIVAFAEDAQAAASHIYRRRPALFANRAVAERRRFVEGADPVRWWSLTQMLSLDGMAMLGNAREAGIAFEGPASADFGVPVSRGQGASLIRENAIVGVGGVMALVDSRGAEGVTVRALADYIAMVALTATVMQASYGGAAGDTVLGLFDSPEARRGAGLTDADRAYLSRLYDLPRDRLAWTQRGSLRHSVRQSLDAQDAAVEGRSPRP